MDDAGIQAADRSFTDFNDLGAGIQQYRHEIFFLFTVELVFYQRGDIDGIFNHRFVVGGRIAFQAIG